jgi:hypothetical protein
MSNMIKVTNTSNGTTIETEAVVLNEDTVVVYVANERITLIRDGDHYVGNKFGLELVYAP